MDTAVNRLHNALISGEELTSKQISSRFGLSNPRDAVYTLRQNGYPVSLVERKDTSGRVKLKYSMNGDAPSVSTYTVKAA